MNSRTQVGGQDTSKWIENLPGFDDGRYEVIYTDTYGDETFKNFEKFFFTRQYEEDTEAPWLYGSYQFFEMDEERHKYKVLSYANSTSPFSNSFYPQFII